MKITLTITMLAICLIGHSQTKVARSQMPISRENVGILSSDTLYLLDDTIGRTVKNSWFVAKIEPKPVFIFVSHKVLQAKIERQMRREKQTTRISKN